MRSPGSPPEIPLPPYAYVRGQYPHPTRDRAGHSFGNAPKFWAQPAPDRWEACRPYLYGIDLFNHGYFWEAHEVWEGLWHASGRKGRTADFLKGLIALAAARLKLREGAERGVRQHAARAQALFYQVRRELGPTGRRCLGLDSEVLARYATELAAIRTVPISSQEARPFLLIPHPLAS